MDTKMAAINTTIEDFFRPIEFICSCCGVYINPRSGRCARVVQTTVCTMLTLLSWLEVGRNCYIVAQEEMMSGTMLALMAYATIEIMSAAITTVTHFTMKVRHGTFVHELYKHSVVHKTAFNDWPKSKRHLIVCLVTMLMLSLLSSLMFLLVYLYTDSAVVSKVYGLEQFNLKGNITALCWLHFAKWILNTRLMCSYVYFCVGVYCVSREFKCICEEMKTVTKLQAYLEQYINTLRLQFEGACSLVSAMNSIFRVFTLVVYAALIPVICFIIYGLIMGKYNSYDTFILSDSIMLSLLHMCVITTAGILLRNKVEEPLTALYTVDLNTYTDRTLNQISMFVHRITNSQIGISVGGLFVIDTSTVLMLVGTILTYAIVVLQMKPLQCQMPITNATDKF